MRLARWARLGLGIALLGGAAGCAFDPGEPYGRVAASLDAHLAELADRDAGDGFQKLSNDFQIQVTTAVLWVDALELQDAGVDAAVASFDPANPPAGYSLCHNGHCHAADGSLVAYEDIAAELASSGGSEPRTVVTMAGGGIDLLTPVAAELSCQPSCALPEGYLVLARLTASGLVAVGKLRDGREPPRVAGVVDWGVDLGLLESPGTDAPEGHSASPAGVFELRLDLPIDENEPPNIAMAFALPMSTKLFDGVDFGAIYPNGQGTVDLNDPSGADAREQLLERVAELQLTVALARSDP